MLRVSVLACTSLTVFAGLDISLAAEISDQGAVAPAEDAAPASHSDHWSFQRPRRPHLPKVRDTAWTRNPIDYFILARLERDNIRPSAEAERSILIRRLSLDLLGLPPTLQELDEYLGDRRPAAYQRLVDRLLASPAYGERWGRHWLDAARYADSNGYTRDFGRQIWKYRDWVLDATNRDLPFDQFTVEQMAGDMLPEARQDQIVATGFHRNTLINEEGGTDQEQFRVDAVADRVATTGAVFLGLTLGCARCHAHKYDPISQREYYQIFAFLNSCDEPMIEAPSAWQVDQGLVRKRAEIRKQIAGLEDQLQQQQEEFEQARAAWEKTITPPQRAKLPGPTQAALDLSVEERTPEQQKLVSAVFQRTEMARRAFPLVDQIAKLRASQPDIPTTMVMRERTEPRETYIHRRGNFLDKGARVQRAVPAVLHSLPGEAQQPNRLTFARWLVAAENPLTPRVIMNRSWQHLFGRGLVETENDFGVQGTPPSHPALLDWLAVQFIEQGWSRKAMHRLIVTSATYRQASHYRPELQDVDPANRLLARQSRLRLEAEVVRDVALAASRLLTRTIGGPSVYPPQPDGVFEFTQDPKAWTTEKGADRFRRGMYTYFWRSSPYPSLMVFDAPSSNVTCTRRVRSSTPLQALTLANDIQFVECAQALAADVRWGVTGDDVDRAVQVFRRCLARSPSPLEQDLFVALLEQQRSVFAADPDAAKQLVGRSRVARGDHLTELAAWTAVCRVILNLDEFITRE